MASLSLLASILIAEVAYRWYPAGTNRPYDAQSAYASCERAALNVIASAQLYSGAFEADEAQQRAALGKQNPHPYYGWDGPIDGRGIIKLADYFASPEHEETFDILILGGSVAGEFAVHAGTRFATSLESSPELAGRPVKIHSGGRAAYKQPQQLTYASFLLALGWRPDAIVNIDGFNEAAIGMRNVSLDSHPIFPEIARWRALTSSAGSLHPHALDALMAMREAERRIRAVLDSSKARHLFRSSLLAAAVTHYIQVQCAQFHAAQVEFSQHATEDDSGRSGGPPYLAPDRDIHADIAALWERSSRLLNALCREHDILYIHVLQPTLHDVGSKTLTENEVASGDTHPAWKEGATHIYPIMRSEGQNLSRSGIKFLDLSYIFSEVPDSVYVDACHYNAGGYLALVDPIAREIAAALRDT